MAKAGMPVRCTPHGLRKRRDGVKGLNLRYIVMKVSCPAQGLSDTTIGILTPALYAEAKKKSWTIISMKNDWKKIFSFE